MHVAEDPASKMVVSLNFGEEEGGRKVRVDDIVA
jgi:hypothetical protein